MLKKIALSLFLILITGSLFSQSNFEVAEMRTISSNKQYLLAPKWSPTGENIAAAGENFGSIWFYNLKTERWQKLVEQNGVGWDFDWSPDSRKIAFRANTFKNRRKLTTIKYVDISSRKIEKVTDENRNFSTPKWISNTAIAFLHNDEYKTNTVVNQQLNMTEKNFPMQNVCLFSEKGMYTKIGDTQAQLLAPLKGQTLYASFSPLENIVLFQKPGSKIFTFEEQTETIKFITEGEMPAWSPDGKSIVFANPKDDGYRIISSDILVCDQNGKNQHQLTGTDDELEMRPNWSPDGKQIACDSNGKIILIKLQNEVK